MDRFDLLNLRKNIFDIINDVFWILAVDNETCQMRLKKVNIHNSLCKVVSLQHLSWASLGQPFPSPYQLISDNSSRMRHGLGRERHNLFTSVLWRLILDLMRSQAASLDRHFSRCSWSQTLLILGCLGCCSESCVSSQHSVPIN